MAKILLYIQERFPIIPVLLFAFGYAALATGSTSVNKSWLIFIFAAIFTFFLLRQRVVDEFKDSYHDLKNFPDRPIPRGLITKQQLIILGGVALFFEWLFVYLLGFGALIAYVPVFLYSLLMAKEFFMPEWLNQHFNLYLLTHEVIFILFGLFFIKTISGSLTMTNDSLLTLGILFTGPFSIEIIRKFSPRYDKNGKPVRDTYGTVWGREATLSILVSLLFLTALFLTLIKDSYFFLTFGLVFFILTLFKSSDEAVKTIGAVIFLGLAILANIF